MQVLRTKPEKLVILGGLVFLFLGLLSHLAFANQPPQLGTITPSSGTSNPNQAVSFTTTYIDPDGWANIQLGYLLINSSSSGLSCFYGYYNQNTNKLYLRNDANTAWLGGFAPGTANTIENSYAKLNCATTTASGSGATLTVTWSITFKSPFTGAKNTYLYVKDDAGAIVSLTKKGAWAITNNAPQVGTITPGSGTSCAEQPVNFITTYTDADTWLNIQYVYFLMNKSTSGVNCFYGYYNQNTNKLYLRNDANNGWLGGFAPGTSNIIENTFAKLDCASTTVSGSGATLTVSWKVTFKSPFTGAKNTYLYVKDNANAYQGWVKKGDFYIFRKAVLPAN
jgi:hypothetical protein